MKSLVAPFVLAAAYSLGFAADFRIQSAGPTGEIIWSGAYTAGVCTVETAVSPAGPWAPRKNLFTTNETGRTRLALTNNPLFCRLLNVDISTNSAAHYTNLLRSYGILETVAGGGQFSGDHVSYWQAANEGGFATNANLSRPHISFGDALGNVYIVDQGSSAVEKVTPDGRIHTYAGTHVAGFNGDGPAPATNLQLRFPNGGWLRADGVFYVLDTENGRVRRIDTNGMMTTLIATDPLGDGRALWVKSDESVIYFGSGPGVEQDVTTLNRWTPAGGITVVSSGFLDIGNILGDERTGVLYICDRRANRIYRMETNGTLVTIAGNGTTTGGGEGFPAVQTGLIQPRSIWFLPNGGFFTTEHDPGNRVWYIDPAGIIHRWLNGSSTNHFRVGDGAWFYDNPTAPKVSRVRSINADPNGNLIITESNFGYVRRIRFERLVP